MVHGQTGSDAVPAAVQTDVLRAAQADPNAVGARRTADDVAGSVVSWGDENSRKLRGDSDNEFYPG